MAGNIGSHGFRVPPFKIVGTPYKVKRIEAQNPSLGTRPYEELDSRKLVPSYEISSRDIASSHPHCQTNTATATQATAPCAGTYMHCHVAQIQKFKACSLNPTEVLGVKVGGVWVSHQPGNLTLGICTALNHPSPGTLFLSISMLQGPS